MSPGASGVRESRNGQKRHEESPGTEHTGMSVAGNEFCISSREALLFVMERSGITSRTSKYF